MKKTELIEIINKAFQEIPYPDEDIVDDIASMGAVEMRKAFQNKNWQELKDVFLFTFRNELSCFSNKGFQYFLPAFMIFMIKKFKKTDTLIDNLVDILTLPEEKDIDKLEKDIDKFDLFKGINLDPNQYIQHRRTHLGNDVNLFHEKMAVFTKEQASAIRLFLTFLHENYKDEYLNDEPLVAINRYWYQFY